MPLTAHDAEETARPLQGKVYDAAEKVSSSRSDYRAAIDTTLFGAETIEQRYNRIAVAAERLISAQDGMINRQSELIAHRQEQLRQALS